MKVHILRPDSITPIAQSIERQRDSPDSYRAQLEFAAVLLYREREYRGMNSSKWFAGTKPAPSVDSPFRPFDITPEAATDLAGIIAVGASGSKPLDKNDRAALLGEIQRDQLETDRALSRAVDAFDERLRQLALRVRRHVEGDAFSRFLSTEAAFCEQERDAALESFDEARVPAALRTLVPLARQIGVGNDGCRAVFMSRMRARDRREAARTIREHGQAIDDWLSSVGPPPYEGEAAAFFWLRAAADDLDS